MGRGAGSIYQLLSQGAREHYVTYFVNLVPFRSIYNVYNIMAAWSVCAICGVDQDKMAQTISSYILKNGRMVTFKLGAHKGTLLTSKHENSVAYDTNLKYIADRKEDCEVMVIVDAISRKYFTGETSWLWEPLHMAGDRRRDRCSH